MKTLKSFLLILVSLVFISFITACSKEVDSVDSKGHPIRLSDYKGKWVIINFWATWCKPCLKEMPTLNSLYQDNRKKLVVLGVSFDKLSQDEIKKVTEKLEIQYPMLSSFPIQKFGIQRLDVLPITFILNPEGKLVKTLRGPQTEAQFRNAVDLS